MFSFHEKKILRISFFQAVEYPAPELARLEDRSKNRLLLKEKPPTGPNNWVPRSNVITFVMYLNAVIRGMADPAIGEYPLSKKVSSKDFSAFWLLVRKREINHIFKWCQLVVVCQDQVREPASHQHPTEGTQYRKVPVRCNSQQE